MWNNGQGGARNPQAQLIWTPANELSASAAVSAAQEADVVIAVVGITSRLEGEEMKVNQPGFLGGDRTSLDMPQQERTWFRRWSPPTSLWLRCL